MKIALCIPHTPWIPDRARSLKRLLDTLGLGLGRTPFVVGSGAHPFELATKLFDEREANWSWADKILRWGIETGADYILQLQDDVEPMPEGFWHALLDMVDAVPDQIIGLETAHEAGPLVHQAGANWCTTNDGLVGVGWIMPRAIALALRDWKANALKEGAIQAITEDTLIDVFAVATGRKIWHPVPTIIDHDTTVASTYGNDGHTRRRPSVTWKHETKELLGWPRGRPFHLGNFYGETVVELARQWLKDWDGDIAKRNAFESGYRDRARLARLARDKVPEVPYRILLATPHRDSVHPMHSEAVLNMVMVASCDLSPIHDIDGAIRRNGDVVFTRSRMLRMLDATAEATDMLFVDSDCAPTVDVLAGMLRARLLGVEGIILAPYARRDGIHFERAVHAKMLKLPAEAGAYFYSIAPPEDVDPLKWDVTKGMVADCSPIAWGGLGCALVPRRAVEQMKDYALGAKKRRREIFETFWDECEKEGAGSIDVIEHLYARASEHREDEAFFDDVDGAISTGGGGWVARETFAPFLVGIHEETMRSQPGRRFRRYLSEDQAFCRFARRAGVKVWAYFGHGSPVPHYGVHCFKGTIEAFGLQRMT